MELFFYFFQYPMVKYYFDVMKKYIGMGIQRVEGDECDTHVICVIAKSCSNGFIDGLNQLLMDAGETPLGHCREISVKMYSPPLAAFINTDKHWDQARLHFYDAGKGGMHMHWDHCGDNSAFFVKCALMMVGVGPSFYTPPSVE